MAKNNQTILIAKNLSDVFYHAKSTDQLQIFGGGTDTEVLQEKALTVRSIPELRGFDRHEHFIDFGPAITLSEMIAIGRTNQPPVLFDALESIATPSIRNIATLGGNIAAKGVKHTLWAPLLALDSRLEFRTQNEVKNIQLSHFTEIPKGFVLTKIRVPTDVWEVAVFRRIGPSNSISKFCLSCRHGRHPACKCSHSAYGTHGIPFASTGKQRNWSKASPFTKEYCTFY